jgi:hypothetical protein
VYRWRVVRGGGALGLYRWPRAPPVVERGDLNAAKFKIHIVPVNIGGVDIAAATKKLILVLQNHWQKKP